MTPELVIQVLPVVNHACTQAQFDAGHREGRANGVRNTNTGSLRNTGRLRKWIPAAA